MKTKFEWDDAKATRNLAKHGVSFETATRVFADPFIMVEQDRFENGEYRWQTLGIAEGHTLLLVAHTVWDEEGDVEVIRIISARHAEPKERKRYEQNRSL